MQIDAVLEQFLLQIGFVSSAGLKKVAQRDFRIHFAVCEKNDMEQETEKNKIFPVQVLFLELPNYKHLFSAIFVILDIVDICFLYS